MNFGLTPEQEMVVSTVRSFVENELYPHEAEVERTDEVPAEVGREITRKVQELGFYAPNMPEELGGGGLDHLTFTLLERELGRASYALRCSGARPTNILCGCNGEQRERYLLPAIRGERNDCLAMTEPGAGSDVRSMKTTAPARRRRLRDQRHQALHQPRRPRRLRDRVRRDRQRGDQGRRRSS